MLQYDFDESVGCWVAMTSHAMRRALDEALARENITLRQWEVLAWIAMEGEPSQAVLADRLGIEAPTLAGVIARMERDGWLERYCCPADRRKKRIRATPKAEAIWNRTMECCHRIRAQATQGITPEELAVVRSVCDRIRQNLASGSSEKLDCRHSSKSADSLPSARAS